MTLSRVFLLFVLSVGPIPLLAGTEYGTADADWEVADNNPTGASISFVDEPLLAKSVVQTVGEGRSNSYLVGGRDSSSGWNNQSETLLSWNMQAAESVTVYVRIDTTLGWRYLQYNHSTKNNLLNKSGRYIHHGLGSTFSDGEWHTWSRDLAADLKDAEPDNDLLAVNGIVLRGNMRIDGIQLNASNQAPTATIDGGGMSVALNTALTLDSQRSGDSGGALSSVTWRDAEGNTLSEDTLLERVHNNTGLQRYSLEVTDNDGLSAIASTSIQVVDVSIPTIYSDAQDGSVDGWRLSDKTPDGAVLANVSDPDASDNLAIQFNSTGIKNSIVIGNTNPSRGWDNTLQTNITWRSRADNDFRVYVRVTTPEGWRYIWYDTRTESRLANSKGNYIHHGLGAEARDGQWHTYTRDLRADLAQAQPDNTVIAVHAVVVRGTVMLDDVALLGDIEVTPPLAAPVITLPEDNTVYESDATIVLHWEADSSALTYEFGSFNALTDSVINSTSFDVSDICDQSICMLSQPNDLPVGNGYQLRVRASNLQSSSDWSIRNFSIVEPVATVPPVAPTIILPEDNTDYASDDTLVLQWQFDRLATSYYFSVFSTITFDNLRSASFTANDQCVQSICTLSWPNDLAAGEGYQFRIAAANDIGSSNWSVRNFTVTDVISELPLATPTIILPTENAEFAFNDTIVVQWQADALASTYDFGLVNPYTEATTYDSGLSASDICDVGICTLSKPSDLPLGEGYQLRIRANNSDGSSEWSERTFSMATAADQMAAAFSVSVLSGPAPLLVTVDAFESAGSAAITEYQWEFADLHTVEGGDLVTTSFEFAEPGSYSISLTVVNAAGQSDTETIIVVALGDNPTDVPTPEAAARLLAQASFGASTDAIAEVLQLGIEGWIDNQLVKQSPSHLDYVYAYSNGSNRDARHEIFWLNAIDGEDQLRARVAFALSQLFVVSDIGYTLSNAQYGVTNFYDILRNHAFGNYRELLEDVTLNPAMGIFLSMLQNDKGSEADNTRADENFAREVLQLFSIGLHNLNQDGTRATGNTFTQDDIESFARVFTGWNYNEAGRWDRPLFTGQDLINPMEPYEDHHDTGAKTLLGGMTIPAGLSAREDLERALDNIFAHQNVAPFISRHLITHLVTSNPTTDYVSRVAAVFNDNGAGVKGDLKATVKAILMDTEARNPSANDNYGKLREPVLRLSHLWRAFSVVKGTDSVRGEYNTYSPALKNLETQTGQAVLRAPSVFNFYQPGYAPNGPVADAGLVAPQFEIFTDGNILSSVTRLNHQIHRHYKQNPYTTELKPSQLDYTAELLLAAEPQALLDRLNLLLLSGAMSTELNDLLFDHLDALPSDTAGLTLRVQDAISLIVASPEYLVQK